MSDQAELCRFLVAAKSATYAAAGDAATVTPRLPGSKQFDYAAAPWIYRDVYVGMSRFAGFETISRAGKPVWAMSYAGGMTLETAAPDALREVYGFLREALLAIPTAQPFRGPARHVRGDLIYDNAIIGTVARLSGVERICRAGVELYVLHYAGGLIV